jgi:PAS domain S-box-containing protein
LQSISGTEVESGYLGCVHALLDLAGCPDMPKHPSLPLLRHFLQIHRYLPSNSFRAYAFAALCAAVGVAVRAALGVWLQQTAPLAFITLFPAVLIAAVFGGIGPGLFAIGLSALYGWYYFAFPATGLPSLAGWVALALFGAGALVMVAVAGALRQALDRLNEAQGKLIDALQVSRTGTWRWNVPADDVEWDEALSRTCGLEPAQAPRSAAQFFDLVHPDDRARVSQIVQRALEGGADADFEFRVVLPDGSHRWMHDRSRVARDAQGRPRIMFGATTEITARKEAELARRQAEQSLNERERHLSIIVEQVPAGIFQADRDGRYTFVNERFCALVGRSRQELIGIGYLDITHPDDRNENERLRRDAITSQGAFTFRKRYLRPDGTPVWTEMSVAIASGGGVGEATLGVVVDLTERMQGEARQELLINELNHRVKNTLASVQSLALMTLRGNASPEAFVRSFFDRVRALSFAHDLLTREHWEGASLRDVANVEVAPYAGDAVDRLTLEGEHLSLRPRQALALGMVFHELATNAAKYGAYSQPSGRVTITWAVARDSAPRLRIDWCERGGPAIAAPDRRGFGTRLIERSIGEDLGGTVAFDYAASGLCCAVEIPLEQRAERSS